MNNSMSKQQQIEQDDLRATRPFLWFLTAVLVFLYGMALLASPALREPQRLIPFTLGMILTGALHWLLPNFVDSKRQYALYLAAQVALAFGLSWLSNNMGIIGGLYLGLAGETIGVLEDWRQSLAVLLGTIMLMVLTAGVMWGWEAVAPEWIGISLLMALFVMLYVLLFMRQMNARAEAQRLLAELEEAHDQLGAYAQEVEQLTLDAERQRMARELHDTLAQGLAGVILQLEGLEAYLEKGDAAQAAAIATQAKSRARETLGEARRAIDDLRDTPSLSPTAAMRSEADRFARATGIPCTVTLPDTLPLNNAQADHALRCVSEGLANAALHAGATETAVTITAVGDKVTVTVTDNGRGFTPATVPAGHYGLLGLRERARLAGGSLDVHSAPGQGTTLTMTLPVTEIPG